MDPFQSLRCLHSRPGKLLIELYGNDLVQGKVIDLSDSGAQQGTFAVVRVGTRAAGDRSSRAHSRYFVIQLCRRFVVPRIRIYRVPNGTKGTLVTARIIARMIPAGAKDFYAAKGDSDFSTYGVRPKDRLGEVSALFDWVRRNIHAGYLRVELLHSARRMLELQAGDCDDMTILLGAMLMSTGHPVRLVLAGFRPNRPHAYSHIYPEVHVRGRWIAIDATVAKPMGWAPRRWKRVKLKGGHEMLVQDTLTGSLQVPIASRMEHTWVSFRPDGRSPMTDLAIRLVSPFWHRLPPSSHPRP